MEEESNDSQLDSLEDESLNERKIQKNLKNGFNEIEKMEAEALKCMIMGNGLKATRLLKEVIQLMPDRPQPYLMLGRLYEQRGEMDNAVQYFFLGTYFSPAPLENWIKTGNMSFKLAMYPQAAYSYGRALKLCRYNIPLLQKRAFAFERNREFKRASITYKRMLKISSSKEIVKNYARFYFAKKEYGQARQILLNYSDEKNEPNIINMISETYVKEKKYKKAIECIEEEYGVEVDFENIPLEILKNIFISEAALASESGYFSKRKKKAFELLNFFIKKYISELSLFYENILKEIISANEEIATKLLETLIKYSEHQSIDNFLFLSQQLKTNHRLNEALELLEQAIKIFPKSLLLIQEHKELNYIYLQEKEEIFYSDDDLNNSEHKAYKKQISFKNENKYVEIEEESKIKQEYEIINDPFLINKIINSTNISLKKMLSENFSNKICDRVNESIEFLSHILHGKNDSEEIYLKEDMYKKRENRQRKVVFESENNNNEEELKNFVSFIYEFIKILFTKKQYTKIIHFSKIIIKFKVLKKKKFIDLKKDIFELSLFACLETKKIKLSLFFIKFLFKLDPTNSLYLMLLNQIRDIRSCGILKKHQKDTTLTSANLHHSLSIAYMESNFFELALVELVKAHADSFHKSEIELCMSVCFLQIASNRNVFNKLLYTNRSAALLQASIGKDKNTPENLYNVARWFAQVRLNYKAISFYEAVLAHENSSEEIKNRTAMSLIILYQNIELSEKAIELQEKYFKIFEE